ncbi:Uncharacterised protein [Bordetella bronchiseptica]|nr:hypothetical protein [Bordetella bronchiseptica]KDD21312.1 hypothetical protein L525_3540 [Bordetella bronchiseptica MBORD782]VTQ77724.1 Uncharacterised protein [Bordetella bronchiseptica]
MTTQNNAAQPVLTDDQIEPLVRNAEDEIERLRRALEAERDLRVEREKAADPNFVMTELRGIICVAGDSPTVIVSVERMRLWLSKLRAPVADERALHIKALQDLRLGVEMDQHYMDDGDAKLAALDAAITALRWSAGALQALNIEADKITLDGETRTVGDILDHADRALASTPVAGEAVAGYMVGTDYFRPHALAGARKYAENRNMTVRILRYADATPQATAEDVRNAALEEAAAAMDDHCRAGREWIPGSLWDALSREAGARIRALKSTPAPTAAEESQASEAVRNEGLKRARKLPEVKCSHCDLKVVSSCGSTGCPVKDRYADLRALSAQPGAIRNPLIAEPSGNPGEMERVASEDVALPPVPSAYNDTGSYIGYAKSDLQAYARAAVLADRQRRSGDAPREDDMLTIAYLAGAQAEKERAALADRQRRNVNTTSSDVDIDRQQRAGEVVEVCPECDIAGCRHIRARAALAAQPGSQKTGGSDE